jgi:hypothetical protein
VWLIARCFKLLVIWLIGGGMLGWARMSAPWRSRLALAASATGVAFLVLGMNSEGSRQSPTLAVVLLGTPYVVGQISASASLSYYLLTGVCLLLGALGLVAGDEVASFLRRRWWLTAVAVSLLVTALRFLLEKAAAPPAWSNAVGIAWLAPLVGAWFALNLREEDRPLKHVTRLLAGYAVVVRGVVIGLVVAATVLRLGTHYDVTPLVRVRIPFSGAWHEFEPGSLDQILGLGVMPQLLFWPLYTIVTGWLGAWIAWTLLAQTREPLPMTPSPGTSPGR